MKEIPNLTQKDIDRFWSKVDKSKDCWEWTSSTIINGYGKFRVGLDTYLAHRIAYKLLSHRLKSDMLVLHKCDNPKCVNPFHLFLGTAKENIHDAQSKNRFPIAKHPSLTSYAYGCRCLDCKEAYSAYSKQRYMNKKNKISIQKTPEL